MAYWGKINGRIRILILGSYERRHKFRLVSLRESLRETGFTETRLVEDFPDDPMYGEDLDIHFTKKSENYMLNWADEILFVLFVDCDNQGVLSEFRFCSILGKGVLENSLVIVEEGLCLSSQIRGPIKITRVNAELPGG